MCEALNKVLWWPIMSGEDVEREFIDQVINPKAKTFKDLGIEPDDIKDFTYQYLVSGSFLEAGSIDMLTFCAARIP